MKNLDPWDIVAAVSVLILAGGVWLIYMPAAFLVVGAVGFGFAWMSAGGKR